MPASCKQATSCLTQQFPNEKSISTLYGSLVANVRNRLLNLAQQQAASSTGAAGVLQCCRNIIQLDNNLLEKRMEKNHTRNQCEWIYLHFTRISLASPVTNRCVGIRFCGLTSQLILAVCHSHCSHCLVGVPKVMRIQTTKPKRADAYIHRQWSPLSQLSHLFQ